MMLSTKSVLGLLALGAKNVHGKAVPVPALGNESTATTEASSTITQAPAESLPVPINTCSYWDSTASQWFWNSPSCNVHAGTVDLVFWPTTGNLTYPSTFYDSVNDYTFTSPSVYMVVHTLYAENACGPLGPSTSKAIFDFDLTQVSTLVPYSDETATTRRATRQLYLSDLGTSCQASFNTTELATQTRPVKDEDTRCNPFLVIPMDIKRWGYPYWKHCQIYNNKFGLFDPPYAIPADTELIPEVTATTTTVPAETLPAESSTVAESASAKPTVQPDQSSATASVSAPEETAAVPPVEEEPLPSSSAPVETKGTPDESDGASSSDISVPVATADNPEESNPSSPSDDVGPEDMDTEHTSATVGDQENAQEPAVPGTTDTAVISDPLAAPDLPSDDAIVSTAGVQIVRLGAEGIEVVDQDSGRTSTYIVPAFGATQQGASMEPATIAVYGGQTLIQGSPAVTVTGVPVVSPGLPASVDTSAPSVVASSPSTVETPSSAGRINTNAVLTCCSWMVIVACVML
ncbi:uncharacterized protein F5Z01DRAFT_102773 [Emericellopsis atlantica]|uniref:Uncharacterized protein n=1 Tax=Emericellopsis atlantica TaxID=2614577 RepID=A0A9P8CPP9_9HYPO|nr:uncharacterized protein F5Z01DRAFT_102773 [Emericellopsis atlantica]KAG9254355.1 hypothetical protein F5Z01DRAFT_102773 [Emericellopsis atlantica]